MPIELPKVESPLDLAGRRRQPQTERARTKQTKTLAAARGADAFASPDNAKAETAAAQRPEDHAAARSATALLAASVAVAAALGAVIGAVSDRQEYRRVADNAADRRNAGDAQLAGSAGQGNRRAQGRHRGRPTRMPARRSARSPSGSTGSISAEWPPARFRAEDRVGSRRQRRSPRPSTRIAAADRSRTHPSQPAGRCARARNGAVFVEGPRRDIRGRARRAVARPRSSCKRSSGRTAAGW